MPLNSYSSQWFAHFGDAVEPAQTAREAQFLQRVLPRDEFRTVLDVCCGSGRHACGLSQAGYSVTGVDANRDAIARARHLSCGATFVVGDMRDLASMPRDFDAVICMWQSFGHFDDQTNQRAMQGMADRLRHGGQIVLDVYNREFFEQHQDARTFLRNGVQIIETKRIEGDRITVHLEYPHGEPDRFQWRLYWLHEWKTLLATCGLSMLMHCCEFDEQRAPNAAIPRMQLKARK